MPVMQPPVLFLMSFSLFLSVRPIALQGQGQWQVGQGRLEHGIDWMEWSMSICVLLDQSIIMRFVEPCHD
jgi:hypothetical protein